MPHFTPYFRYRRLSNISRQLQPSHRENALRHDRSIIRYGAFDYDNAARFSRDIATLTRLLFPELIQNLILDIPDFWGSDILNILSAIPLLRYRNLSGSFQQCRLKSKSIPFWGRYVGLASCFPPSWIFMMI